MARTQERFAYPFERDVIELDQRIETLMEEGADSAQIDQLRSQREDMLRELTQNLTPYERVLLARHPQRPLALDYINLAVTDFMELHGDRRYRDDHAIITGFGKVDGHKCMVIAQQKGRETKEKVRRNFGMPHAEGYRKALLKMKLAEQFGLPVLCIIDTPGAACDQEAEERGIAMAIAENLFEMARLRTPLVLVNVGEACSGGGACGRFCPLPYSWPAPASTTTGAAAWVSG